jgi:molybdenum cofactor guanylyltransferase
MTRGVGPDAVAVGDASKLLGVVLAGGKSSRMGIDKAMLPHHQRDTQGNPISYLQYAVERLLPLVSCVAVVGRNALDLQWVAPRHVIALADNSPDSGPAMGVATALRYAAVHGFEAALVTPVDMPDLRTQQLQQLMRARGDDVGVVCASFGEARPEPLLAIYPVSVLAALQQVLASPRRSLSRWLREQPPKLVAYPRQCQEM